MKIQLLFPTQVRSMLTRPALRELCLQDIRKNLTQEVAICTLCFKKEPTEIFRLTSGSIKLITNRLLKILARSVSPLVTQLAVTTLPRSVRSTRLVGKDSWDRSSPRFRKKSIKRTVVRNQIHQMTELMQYLKTSKLIIIKIR